MNAIVMLLVPLEYSIEMMQVVCSQSLNAMFACKYLTRDQR